MPRSLFLVLALVPGCASAPSAFSSRSAASPSSTAAPAPVIARALREEPPAPGTSTEGWAGLGSTPAAGSMAHHHHHPGMVMPTEGDHAQ